MKNIATKTDIKTGSQFNLTIKLTKSEVEFLKNLVFDGRKDDKNYYFSHLTISDTKKNERLTDSMVGLGIFQYVVTSWGYQEHAYTLTLIGKMVYDSIVQSK